MAEEEEELEELEELPDDGEALDYDDFELEDLGAHKAQARHPELGPPTLLLLGPQNKGDACRWWHCGAEWYLRCRVQRRKPKRLGRESRRATKNRQRPSLQVRGACRWVCLWYPTTSQANRPSVFAEEPGVCPDETEYENGLPDADR